MWTQDQAQQKTTDDNQTEQSFVMHLRLLQQSFKVKACPQPDTDGEKAAVMDESIWASVPNCPNVSG